MSHIGNEEASAVKTKDSNVFYLEGLNCPNCAAKIEESLNNNESFKSVNFSFATKKLVVENTRTYVDSMTIITETVNKIEDGVRVMPEVGETKEFDNRKDLESTKKSLLAKGLVKYWKTILGVFLLGLSMAFLHETSISMVGYLIAYVLIGGDVAFRAFRNILKGQWFDENFLMTIATFGAFALGEYVEAVAVILFYKIGEGFQNYAVDHSRRSIKSLLNIKSEYANLIKGDDNLRNEVNVSQM